MQSKAATVDAYLKSLPEDRRAAIGAIRGVIRKNLPRGYAETMQYGMIGYNVPHSIYPDGYHCDPRQPLPFASLASQKNHMALYLMCIYGMESHRAWFVKAWEATGKKLDMGKGCVRFKRLEDVPLEVVGEAIARVPVKEFVEYYDKSKPASAKKKSAKPAAKKAPVKKTTKKAVTKATAQKTTKNAAKKVTKKPATRKKSSAR
ncbi:MAG: DUF1801 domain-containing protein [Phycisphaerales bacterium]|nr:DUF1801 domain-containing protein [Phycisphaerales bacterium]MCB9835318.1 DUF1801 domain-containing protein [Phycisphaera sp.]